MEIFEICTKKYNKFVIKSKILKQQIKNYCRNYRTSRISFVLNKSRITDYEIRILLFSVPLVDLLKFIHCV